MNGRTPRAARTPLAAPASRTPHAAKGARTTTTRTTTTRQVTPVRATGRSTPPASRRSGASHARAPRPAWARTATVLLGFGLLWLGIATMWGVPRLTWGVYLVASLLCFVVYAVDKSAAIAGRWRTPENQLHLLGLAGGWPGALLAQQMLRHKSSKASFQLTFWITVLLNVAGFVLLHTPLGPQLFDGLVHHPAPHRAAGP